MPLWVAVHGFRNQEQVEETVLNRPIYELVERTNYLYSFLQDLVGAGAFESVRVASVALVRIGDTAPVVGDFVYLDETQNKYAKAIASPSAIDVFAASNSAYSLGLLVSISGTVGTVVLYGKCALATSGSGWNLSTLLETGETFRNGPYYLSSREAGKMTATPSGPAIYLGYMLEDADNLGYGGFAMLSPQYKDMKEAHAHRAYPLFAQPAGTQSVSGPTPIDIHTVLGFETEAAATAGDQIPRLVPLGVWLGTDDTEYTIWLSNSNSSTEVRATSSPPTSWGNCYLHWESSDTVEASGVTRIWSYESPVSVGTKGLVVSLENAFDPIGWDEPYYPDPYGSGDDPDKRTWIIDVPTMTEGWLARKYRQYFADHPATNQKYSFILMGGPHSTADARLSDIFTVKCAKLYNIVWTGNAADTETVTIGSTVFEFDDDASITAGRIAVPIDSTSADNTFVNLMEAILAQNIVGVDVASLVSNTRLIIGVPAAVAVSDTVANATTSLLAAGAGDLSSGTANLMIYDQYHVALVATSGYWASAQYWTPQVLTNSLYAMAIPYDSDGTAATGNTVAVGDYWNVDIADEAPGAYFVYSIGMQQGLYAYYPPIPLECASMVLNGVELDGYHLFPANPTYRLSLYTAYWYSNLLGRVPWPQDWVDISNPGTYVLNLALNFVRMSVGNTGIVTSLRPAPNSPIRVLKCGTNDDGTVGDLSLDLALDIQDEDANLTGYQVYKAVSGSMLRKGPVVERIVGGPGITVTQPVGTPTGRGVVTISGDGSAYGGEFEEVALQNAKQELIGMFPYIRLLGWTSGGASNVASGFVAKFRVPHTLGYGVSTVPSYKCVVYMTVFGEVTIPYAGGAGQQYAGIDFEYSILPDFFPVSYNSAGTLAWNSLDQTLPDGLMTLVAPIHADIPFGEPTANPIYEAYDPMLIHNNSSEDTADENRRIAQVLGNPFPTSTEIYGWPPGQPPTDCVVKPGSIVGIRVQRSAATAGLTEYTSAIGIINIRWRLLTV